jgi:hypothetical protein
LIRSEGTSDPDANTRRMKSRRFVISPLCKDGIYAHDLRTHANGC